MSSDAAFNDQCMPNKFRFINTVSTRLNTLFKSNACCQDKGRSYTAIGKSDASLYIELSSRFVRLLGFIGSVFLVKVSISRIIYILRIGGSI
jgi:hypothetical protein